MMMVVILLWLVSCDPFDDCLAFCFAPLCILSFFVDLCAYLVPPFTHVSGGYYVLEHDLISRNSTFFRQIVVI